MKIDAHQHFWNYDPVKYSWIDESMAVIQKNFLPRNLQPVLERNKIDACIAVQADQSESETEFLLKLATEHSFIKGVVGWLDLKAQNMEERLNYYSKNPFFKGVRHTVYDKEGEFLKDPAFRNGISKLKKYGLTYDLLVFDYQLSNAIHLAKQFPDQPFVVDHMGKPVISSEQPAEEWVSNIQKLGKCSNVYCKLSGLVTQTPEFKWRMSDFYPFLDVVVNAFGTERLIFGSDWPVCLSAASYEEIIKIIKSYFSEYSKEVEEKIFGRNAIAFYNIENVV